VSPATPPVEPVVMDLQLPAGAAGPTEVSIDVRCFVVPYSEGIVLVDTGVSGSQDGIGAALDNIGASWGDVSDVVLTHWHPDHVGGLAEAAARAPSARVWAGLEDQSQIPWDELQTLGEGDLVRDLRVLKTPGHTPGHLSLVHDEASLLFVGDCVGTAGPGGLARGPEMFTADPEEAERSLRRLAEVQTQRVLFSHGPEISDPLQALRTLVE
jgi:glyoxylase-like metal-dependent hydrolase (beta-lactamase superfamily II)